MPAWERELLLEQFLAHEGGEETPPEDPFAAPPQK